MLKHIINVSNVSAARGRAVLLALAMTAVSSAQDSVTVRQPVLDRHLEHAEAVSTFHASLYDNPAWQQNRYATSLNRISLGYDNRHATVPSSLEDGDGHVFWGGSADAYLRKGKTALWGFAHYQKGTVRNIKFNETEDWRLVYPYVMADTVGGGDSRQEHYDFSGGFATALGQRWTIGAEGRYTALLDYRTRDPRPKNLTSDLLLRVGATYRPWQRYALGAAFSFRRYKQTNEVKFYNEVGIPTTFHLTGLGTDYYRFRGENTDTYYKASDLGGAVQLAPRDGGSGVYATAAYHYMSMDKIISSLNELPLTNLKTSLQTASAGYQWVWGGHVVGVRAGERYERRKGTENIFGSAASNVYPQIASAPQYKGEHTVLSWAALYQYRAAGALYSVETGMDWAYLRERHNEPWRHLKSDSRTNYVQGSAAWRLSRWLLQASGIFAYTHAGDVTFEEGGDLTADILPPLEHRLAAISRDAWHCGAGTEAQYAFTRFSLFARFNWQYAHYLSHAHTGYKVITIGLEF